MKSINIVLGLGTAIIIGSLIVLGIAAFYPEPAAPDYSTYVPNAAAPYPAPCAAGDKACSAALKQYQDQQTKEQNAFTEAQDAYEASIKIYDSNLFIAANVIGMIVFAIGFLLLLLTAIAARGALVGLMLAGLWGIVYGYARGWGSTNDQLKFFVGLAIAVLVIGGSIWLIDRYQKKRTVQRNDANA